MKNIETFIKNILKLYNYKIVGAFVMLYLILSLSHLDFVPDYLNLGTIENPAEFILKLWTIVISSSSIILTILLVVYSAISKAIKRNSIDLIVDNPWIKISFSLFGGSFIYLSLSLFIIRTLEGNSALTILYTSIIITVIYIFLQFPLIIMCLKYSNSFSRIKKVSNRITKDNINCLLNPPEIDDNIAFIEYMESNPIILLKDIATSSIKDNDWSLPQIIISELYDKLIVTIDNDKTIDEISNNLYAFNFICNHVKNYAIENNDNITINILIYYSVKTQNYFVENNIKHLRDNYFDEFIKDFFRSIVESNRFYNIQRHLIENACQIVLNQIESIHYTDEEFPTFYFDIDRSEKGLKTIRPNDLLNGYLFYIVNELPEILFDTLLYAIKTGNKNVYDQYNVQLQNLFLMIYNSGNLTNFQCESIFDSYFRLGYKVSDTAIKYEIYENIEIISDVNIVEWIVGQRRKGYYCLYYFSDLMIKLNNANALSKEYIYDFFHIATKLLGEKFDSVLKFDSVGLIIQTGIDIKKQQNTSEIIKKEVLGHLKAINSIYLKKENELLELKDKYSSIIDSLTY